MKNNCYKIILLTWMLSGFFTLKSYGEGNRILFVQPSVSDPEIKAWMKEQEKKIDPANCNLEFDTQNLKDLDKPYKKGILDKVRKYKYWIFKTVSKNENRVTITYELHVKKENSIVNDGKPKVLGIYKGFVEDRSKDDFDEWFEKSISRYCKKLLSGSSLNFQSVTIGLMSSDPAEINNAPVILNLALLDYTFKKPNTGNFIDRYIVSVDNNVSSKGSITINMDKMENDRSNLNKKITLKVIMDDRDVTPTGAKKPVISLNDKTFNSSLKTVAATLAEIIVENDDKRNNH